MEPSQFFGQPQHIPVAHIKEIPQTSIKSQSVTLAVIRACIVEETSSIGTPYFTKMGALDVVDIGTIDCLVGRVSIDGRRFAIIDRSTSIPRSLYVDTD